MAYDFNTVTIAGKAKDAAHLTARIKNSIKKDPLTEVMLIISVGQDYHENGKFKGTLKFLTDLGFNRFIVVVADTLQRYSFGIDSVNDLIASADSQSTSELLALVSNLSNPAVHHTRAVKDGSRWISSHTPDLDRFIPRNKPGEEKATDGEFKIFRWDDIINLMPTPAGSAADAKKDGSEFNINDAFKDIQTQLTAIYNAAGTERSFECNGKTINAADGCSFKLAVEQSIKAYLDRVGRRQERAVVPRAETLHEDTSESIYQKIADLCRKYIIEEAAALAALELYFRNQGRSIPYFAYPGGIVEAVSWVRKKLLPYNEIPETNVTEDEIQPLKFPYEPINLAIGERHLPASKPVTIPSRGVGAASTNPGDIPGLAAFVAEGLAAVYMGNGFFSGERYTFPPSGQTFEHAATTTATQPHVHKIHGSV